MKYNISYDALAHIFSFLTHEEFFHARFLCKDWYASSQLAQSWYGKYVVLGFQYENFTNSDLKIGRIDYQHKRYLKYLKKWEFQFVKSMDCSLVRHCRHISHLVVGPYISFNFNRDYYKVLKENRVQNSDLKTPQLWMKHLIEVLQNNPIEKLQVTVSCLHDAHLLKNYTTLKKIESSRLHTQVNDISLISNSLNYQFVPIILKHVLSFSKAAKSISFIGIHIKNEYTKSIGYIGHDSCISDFSSASKEYRLSYLRQRKSKLVPLHKSIKSIIIKRAPQITSLSFSTVSPEKPRFFHRLLSKLPNLKKLTLHNVQMFCSTLPPLDQLFVLSTSFDFHDEMINKTGIEPYFKVKHLLLHSVSLPWITDVKWEGVKKLSINKIMTTKSIPKNVFNSVRILNIHGVMEKENYTYILSRVVHVMPKLKTVNFIYCWDRGYELDHEKIHFIESVLSKKSFSSMNVQQQYPPKRLVLKKTTQLDLGKAFYIYRDELLSLKFWESE